MYFGGMPPRSRISLTLSLLLAFTGMAGAASGSGAPAEAEVGFRDFFGLSFKRPVLLTEIPGHPDNYLVVEQPGTIVFVRPGSGGRGWEKSVFATMPVAGGRFFEDERGLLGLAFHPRFKDNGKYYVNYISAASGSTIIAERQADAARTKDAGKPERVVLEVAQPYPNHNGGTIAFGSDGFLYIGMGDGGSGGDPENRAQNPHKYRPEVWALGLRNPWKWTFHPETGALWAADVGQNEREEVSIVPRGGNMGWRRWEGDKCQEADKCGAGASDGMVAPLVSLPRGEAVSITGGEFVTAEGAGGSTAPFAGAYIFGDYGKGTVWALTPRQGGWERIRIGYVPAVSAFARDGKGRIFALGLKDGVIRVLDFPKSK
jgi:hypothetical protein